MYQAPVVQDLYESESLISEEEEVLSFCTHISDEEKLFSEKEDEELSLEEMYVADEKDVVHLKE